MTPKTIYLAAAVSFALLTSGCGGAYSPGSVRGSVGFGFYHSTHGHGWGSGYYRGYDRGAADAVELMETVETIETIDAIDGMGQPDFDMGPGVDLGF